MIRIAAWFLLGLLVGAGCCTAQEQAPAREEGSATDEKPTDVIDVYIAKQRDCSCKLRLTPDVAVDGLLAMAIADGHLVTDRIVWALRAAGTSYGRGVPGNLVATTADRRAACGAAYTPVWGDERAAELEVLIARLIGAGHDPWANVPADLQVTGTGLWGRHGGVHGGLSPLPGGFADEKAAVAAWRSRCLVDDVEAALDAGGVIGVLLFRCLQSDAKTQAALMNVVRRSKKWRYDPRSLMLRWTSRSPESAHFSDDRSRWQAVHAAARRLLALTTRLRDQPSFELEHRMRPRSSSFARSLVGSIKELLPVYAAGAEGEWREDLGRRLDSLLQPPVQLSYYQPKQQLLGFAESWEGSFFSARIVAK